MPLVARHNCMGRASAAVGLPPLTIDSPMKGPLVPQTPLLKGRDALANATSGAGSAILSVSFIGYGIRCFTSPAHVASSYGLGAASDGWVAAIGVRNIALGVQTLVLICSHRSALRVFVPGLALVPIGDCYVVAAYGSGSGFTFLCAACCILLVALAIHFDPLLKGRMILGRAVLDDM